MNDLIVRREPMETPPPPRRIGALVAVGSVALVALLSLFGGSDVIPDDRLPLAVTTTTPITPTIPIRDDPPATVAGQTLVDAATFASGPSPAWVETPLPEGVTAIYGLGEIAGRLALLATTEPVDASGLFPGIGLFFREGDRWTDSAFTLGAGEQVVTADVGPGGFVVVVSLDAAAHLPYESDQLVVYESPDGSRWQRTSLSEDGGDRLVNVHAVAGGATTPAMITALVVPDDFPAITLRLPRGIRDLVERGSAGLSVHGDRVSVMLPIGFSVYEATIAELGVEIGDTEPAGARRAVQAWRSSDQLGFAPAELPGATGPIAAMVRGADGRLLIMDAGRQVIVSDDGIDWRSVGRVDNAGFGMATIQSIGGAVLSIQTRTVTYLDGGLGEYLLDPPEGRGISPHVTPATGQAGLALATSTNGPEFAVRVAPTVVETAGLRFVIDPADDTISVLDESGVVGVYRAGTDDGRVTYDAQREMLVLDGAHELSIDGLERAYLAGLHPAARGPFGVAFSPDGVAWGWSPVVDEGGGPTGPIARLAVGESSIYAVIAPPSLPNIPIADLGAIPRLLVGSLGP
jgi:hypothetical protein